MGCSDAHQSQARPGNSGHIRPTAQHRKSLHALSQCVKDNNSHKKFNKFMFVSFVKVNNPPSITVSSHTLHHCKFFSTQISSASNHSPMMPRETHISLTSAMTTGFVIAFPSIPPIWDFVKPATLYAFTSTPCKRPSSIKDVRRP